VLPGHAHLDPGVLGELLDRVGRRAAEEVLVVPVDRRTCSFALRGRHLAGIRRGSRHLSRRLLPMPTVRIAWLHVTHTCEDIGTFLLRRRMGMGAAAPATRTWLLRQP